MRSPVVASTAPGRGLTSAGAVSPNGGDRAQLRVRSGSNRGRFVPRIGLPAAPPRPQQTTGLSDGARIAGRSARAPRAAMQVATLDERRERLRGDQECGRDDEHLMITARATIQGCSPATRTATGRAGRGEQVGVVAVEDEVARCGESGPSEGAAEGHDVGSTPLEGRYRRFRTQASSHRQCGRDYRPQTRRDGDWRNV